MSNLVLHYPSEDWLVRIGTARAQLMRVAVFFVTDGKDGTRNERLRMASELSGIPLNLIDVAASECE